MDLSNGVGKRGGATKKAPRRNPSRKSRPISRNSRKSNRLPKTANIRSRKSIRRTKMSRATSAMSTTELQFMAKSRGVPFGGLSKNKLIKKINNYMY